MSNEDNLYNNFISSINELYSINDNMEKKKIANDFLIYFDKSPLSLNVSIRILNSPNLNDTIYYNALQILKNKIKFENFNFENKIDDFKKLIEFMINKINTINEPQYLITNYCICFSMLMLFSEDNFFNYLKLCVNTLSKNSNFQSKLNLLLIFDFLADNALNEEIVIDEYQRDKFISNYQKNFSDIFDYISNLILNINNIENDKEKTFMKQYILDCIINLIKLGIPEEIIKMFDSKYVNIIDFIFDIETKNINLYTDCICELLSIKEIQDNLNINKKILEKIFIFKDKFYKEKIEYLEEDDICFYVDIFILFINNNLEEILNEKRIDLIKILLDLIKICPSKKLESLNDFFYDFFKIYNKNIDDVKKILNEYFINLIYNLKFNQNNFEILNKNKSRVLNNDDEYEETFNKRDISKKFLHYLINENKFDFILNEILLPIFYKITNDLKLNNNIDNWIYFETTLFVISCIDSYNKFEKKNFFDIIFNIPKEYLYIIRTISYILGIIKFNENEKDLLNNSFIYLINNIDNPIITKYISKNLEMLLVNNKQLFFENSEQLLNVYDERIKEKILINDKYIFLAKGIINCIINSNDINNLELIQKNLVRILSYWVNFMNEIINKINQNNNVIFSEKDLGQIMNLLTIIKELSQSYLENQQKFCEIFQNIIIDIFNEIFPKLKILFNFFLTNSNIIEILVQITKYYMRGLVLNFKKYLNDYLEILINGYKSYPISSYIYGFETIITVFGPMKDYEIRQILDNFLSLIIEITFNKYLINFNEINNENNNEINENLQTDFFGLLMRITKKSPTLMFNNKYFEKIINFTIDNILVPIFDVAKNILKFLDIVWDPKKYIFDEIGGDTNFEQIFQNISEKNKIFAQNLLVKIFNLYQIVPPTELIELLDDMFYTYLSNYGDVCINIIINIFSQLPKDILNNREKENFVEMIKNIKNNKEKFYKFTYLLYNRSLNKSKREEQKFN